MIIHPASEDRWDDLAALFGPNGAYSNCWCTWWMLPGRRFDATPPADRRSMLDELVRGGAEPGLLAYQDGRPVGWVAVGPRRRYARMMSARARVNGPLDPNDPGWVVNCFYIPRSRRGEGIATALLAAAVEFAFDRGAGYVAGHPIDVHGDGHGDGHRDGHGDGRGDGPGKGPGAAALYVGTLSMFLSAGFEVAEWRGNRPVVRRDRPAG